MWCDVCVHVRTQVGFFRLRRKERITKEKERMVSHSAGVTASTTAGATVDLDSKPEEDDNLDSKPVSIL